MIVIFSAGFRDHFAESYLRKTTIFIRTTRFNASNSFPHYIRGRIIATATIAVTVVIIHRFKTINAFSFISTTMRNSTYSISFIVLLIIRFNSACGRSATGRTNGGGSGRFWTRHGESFFRRGAVLAARMYNL